MTLADGILHSFAFFFFAAFLAAFGCKPAYQSRNDKPINLLVNEQKWQQQFWLQSLRFRWIWTGFHHGLTFFSAAINCALPEQVRAAAISPVLMRNWVPFPKVIVSLWGILPLKEIHVHTCDISGSQMSLCDQYFSAVYSRSKALDWAVERIKKGLDSMDFCFVFFKI